VASDSATVGEEEYLQILFWLQEAGLPMTGANVARAMQLSAPTVHEMVGRLERDGYITRGQSRTIAFTDDGAQQAEGIVRRHRLIERFLTDVLGIPWDEVHEEAERLEHAVSDTLIERMAQALGHPRYDPHGAPIPTPQGEIEEADLVSLADARVGATLELRQVGTEDSARLRYLAEQGLTPGVILHVTDRQPFNGPTTVALSVGTRIVGRELALLLWCRARDA